MKLNFRINRDLNCTQLLGVTFVPHMGKNWLYLLKLLDGGSVE